jgi:hypothetical protein
VTLKRAAMTQSSLRDPNIRCKKAIDVCYYRGGIFIFFGKCLVCFLLSIPYILLLDHSS